MSDNSLNSGQSDDDNWNETLNLMDRAIELAGQVVYERTTRPKQRRRRTTNPDRDRELGYRRLVDDYFSDNPVYSDTLFRTRFRMRKHVFLRIHNAIEASDVFFQRTPDATGRMSISGLQKSTAAMRMLAYGVAADGIDEYLRMSAATSRNALLKFCEGVIRIFGPEYLRRPTANDLARLLYVGEQRGFPGMMGSIDCMHWEWKNCPAAWKGQHQGRAGKATLILEAVASYDLWIWHSFFGIPGSCNDLNVLQQSPVFDDILEGRAPPVNYEVNGVQYDMGYYLTDGIYPQWAAFIQSILHPHTPKHRLFAEVQEATRKDVERAFGVLQARFAIIRNPALAWSKDVLSKIMTACIIMHNMIVEDERDCYANFGDIREFMEDRPGTSAEATSYSTDRIADIHEFFVNQDRVRDRNQHLDLKGDLIEHIWQRYGRGAV